MDGPRRHSGLSRLRQELHRALRGAIWRGGGRAPARRRACADARRAWTAIRASGRSACSEEERREPRTQARTRAGLQRPLANRARRRRDAAATKAIDRRRALLRLPQENILYFLEKAAPKLAALAARGAAHRASDRPIFLSAAADQGDERGLRDLFPLPHHEHAARERADRRRQLPGVPAIAHQRHPAADCSRSDL